jgi:hypothetical protein
VKFENCLTFGENAAAVKGYFCSRLPSGRAGITLIEKL